MHALSSLPVAVIGAGPVGLAAAAHLLHRGEQPLVLEAGDSVGASIRAWGHVRLFSPWKYVIDGLSGALLEESGWKAPPADDLPTGNELVDRYLLPLAGLPALASMIRLSTRVTAVTRHGFDKMKTDGRDEAPFAVYVQSPDGVEETLLARAVIDASGTYTTPNPLGAAGIPAGGERALADRIFYGIPDVLGAQRDRYAGQRVLVVGSGHSAFNVLGDLATLAGHAPGTSIIWAIRRPSDGPLYGGGEADALPARGDLGARMQRLVNAGRVHLHRGVKIRVLRRTDAGIEVVHDGGVLPPVDQIAATTGFRPDLSLTGELRLALDPAVEAPAALAPLIDPNLHSCGTVPPHGAAELAHPEGNFYTVGMKSYGRAPTFLLLTGYEQVRSVVCAITGDLEGARNVRLVLPETGVCSTASCCTADSEAFIPLTSLPANACCGAEAPAPLSVVAPSQEKARCCGRARYSDEDGSGSHSS